MRIDFTGTWKIREPRERVERTTRTHLENAGFLSVQVATTERNGLIDVAGSADGPSVEAARAALVVKMRGVSIRVRPEAPAGGA